MKSQNSLFCLLVVLIISFTQSKAEQINGVVTKVVDGNTIEIKASDDQFTVVLLGVDSPDPGQAFADQATTWLAKFLEGKNVAVELKGKDRWGNRLAIVYVKDDDVRLQIVRQGLAWVDEKNAEATLREAELKAREKQKGIWKQDNPTPPWVYRRQQSMVQPKSS